MRAMSNNSLQKKEFRQRVIVSAAVMGVILAMTVFVLSRFSANTEAHAFTVLKEAAEASDARMVMLVDDTFSALESIAVFQSSDITEDSIRKVLNAAVGPLRMETRMYFPDGRAFSGAGPLTDAASALVFEDVPEKMENDRYISCTKYDLSDPSHQIMEFFVPVRQNGKTVALLSAVLQLEALPDFMRSVSYGGQADVLFLDTRDGTFFLDTFHKSVNSLAEHADRKDKDGNSIIPFLEKMLSCRETYTTLDSHSTGKILYLYAIPSGVTGWSACISAAEDIAFEESISIARNLSILSGAEILICLFYIVWMFSSAKKQALTSSQELLNRMAGEDGLFLIDCVRDTRKTIHDHCAGADRYTDDESYSESIAKYVENCVAETDRPMMREVTSAAYMLARLKTENEYTVEYRDVSTDIQRFFKMRIVKYSDTEVLQSFAEKDKEIVDRMMFNKLKSDYFALFAVDLDAGLLQVLKKGPWETAGEEGTVEPYTLALKKLAASFEGEAKQFFEQISDIGYLRRRFATEDRMTFVYRIQAGVTAKWSNVTLLVLTRHENGVPSIFALCFSMLDTEAGEKADLQLKLGDSMNMVGGLASEYSELYHVDLDTGEYTPYYVTEKNKDVRLFFSKCRKFTDLVNSFAASRLVHPDHRERIFEFYTSDDSVRKALRDRKKMSILFQRNYGGEYLWTEADIIKCEEVQDEAHNVIVGIIEKDAEVKRELESREQYREAEEARRLTETITSQYNIVYQVNMADDSFTVRRMDETMLEKEGDFRTFSEAKEYTLTKVMHPRDRERMRRELDFATIREKLSKKPSYAVEYCILKNGMTMWGEMNITSIGEDRIILGMAEKDIEIPRRRLEELRDEKYFAFYYIDLDTEMIREVKNTSGYETEGASVAVPYSQKMREYALTQEGEAKDFFMQLADVAYVRKELAVENKRTYAFRSRLSEGWVEAVSYVIERHEDGTPAIFSLGFSRVDSLSAARQEFQTRLMKDMQILNGIPNGYRSLYHVIIDENILKAYYVDGEKIPESKRIVSERRDAFARLRKYGRSDLIHPEDRRMFDDLTAEGVRDKLAHSRSFSFRFRQKSGEEYLWSELYAVKCEDIDEPANVIAIGLT